jgi:hypothetical protein
MSAQRIESLAKQRSKHDTEIGVALNSNNRQKQKMASADLNRVWNEMKTLSKDLYRRPEQTLDNKDLQLYYDKIRPYYHFYIDAFFIGDSGIIHLEPDDEGQSVTREEANTLLPKTSEETEARSQFVLIPKAQLSESYVWKKTPITPVDEIDSQFIKEKGQSFEKLDLYGLHTYGGYHGFFRPDLKEVIHLLNEKISLTDLEDIDRIYVTTEPHPTDSIYDNLDREQDMHRAKTCAFIVRKKETQLKGLKRKITELSSTSKKKAKPDPSITVNPN